MTKYKRDCQREVKRGVADFKAGKPIEAFYDYPGRRTESLRASYEIGWRSAKRESKAAKDNETRSRTRA